MEHQLSRVDSLDRKDLLEYKNKTNKNNDPCADSTYIFTRTTECQQNFAQQTSDFIKFRQVKWFFSKTTDYSFKKGQKFTRHFDTLEA